MKHRRLLIAILPFVVLWLAACACSADTSLARLAAGNLNTWKLVGGIVLGVEMLAFGIGVGKLQGNAAAGVISCLVGAALVSLLAYSKVGELVYVIFQWFMEWAGLGPVFYVIMSVIQGLLGPLAALSSYVVGGFVYRDVVLMQYSLLPAMISAAATSLGVLLYAAAR